MYHYRQIIVRMRLGESDRAIAKTGLMGRHKIAAICQQVDPLGWLDPIHQLPEDSELEQVFDSTIAAKSTSLANVHQEDIKSWHEDGLKGTTIYQALVRKYGFDGSYSSIRRFLQKYKQTTTTATSVIDFEPGDAAQVDFGKGPEITDVFTGEVIKTWIFVMVLCCSRHSFAEIVRDQWTQTWLACHRHAFNWFNGVSKRVIIDNPKCAITKACYYDPVVQRSYADCAESYGFLISPCPVRDPQKKGIVESGVKYVKNNFVPLREFRSIADANDQLKTWLLGEAGNRIHGTTKQRPLSQFIDVERNLLGPLPDRTPELYCWGKAKLHGDCHLQFENCRYSAPYRLVHEELWLRASYTLVDVFHEQQLVASHPRSRHPGTRSTIKDHLPPEAQAYWMRDPQWCLKQADQIGGYCKTLIDRLFQDKVLDNLRAAQGIIGFDKSYGSQRLNNACERALAYDNPRYRTVKTILAKGLDTQPKQQNLSPLENSYQGEGRFCRDTKTFFDQ